MSSQHARLDVHGDSFAGPLTLLHTQIVKVFKYRGASARGLSNPAATLRVAPRVVGSLRSRRPSRVMLLFGNVDLHVHFLYQWVTKKRKKEKKEKGEEEGEKTGEDRGDVVKGPEEWADFVWGRYAGWLESEVIPLVSTGSASDGDAQFIEHLVLGAALLPTVSDEHLPRCFASYTSLDPPTPLPSSPTPSPSSPADQALPGLELRAAAVERFNARLEGFCRRAGPRLHYADVNPMIRARARSHEGGGPPRVDPRFTDPNNPADIHPSWERTVLLWVDVLSGLRCEDGGDGCAPETVVDISRRHLRVNLQVLEEKYRKRGKIRA